jgi:hypothetical protein
LAIDNLSELWSDKATLELEYSSHFSLGTGVSSETATYKANPFDGEGDVHQSETVELDEIKRTVVKSAYD